MINLTSTCVLVTRATTLGKRIRKAGLASGRSNSAGAPKGSLPLSALSLLVVLTLTHETGNAWQSGERNPIIKERILLLLLGDATSVATSSSLCLLPRKVRSFASNLPLSCTFLLGLTSRPNCDRTAGLFLPDTRCVVIGQLSVSQYVGGKRYRNAEQNSDICTLKSAVSIRQSRSAGL